jgi:hypothetical protein
MTKIFPRLLATLLLAGLACSARAADERRPIFNGTDFSGWHARPHIDPREIDNMAPDERQEQLDAWMAEAEQHWTVEDETLINDGKGPYLATDEKFADFDLTLEYAISEGADSGVYLRGGPQVQIWDPANPDQHVHGNEKGSGGLWNNPAGWPGKDPLVKADHPIGEFNSMRIVMVGSRVSVWLNERLVVDHALMDNFFDRGKPMPWRGPIVLQTHGGQTKWRDLNIREIEPDEATKILNAGGAAHVESPRDRGFEPLFNGSNLDGWQGASDEFRVEDGNLVGARGKGILYTTEQFADFAVRVDFKLSHHANSGFAIRYPGEGNPAYAGMCELQVLDTHVVDARGFPVELRPQQVHGSAYGMAGALQGFLHPVGAWNHQEMTVTGHAIRIELNGNVILDVDLSDTESLEMIYPPETFAGRLRPEGHFGIAGHKSDVGFRNIDVKRLD